MIYEDNIVKHQSTQTTEHHSLLDQSIYEELPSALLHPTTPSVLPPTVLSTLPSVPVLQPTVLSTTTTITETTLVSRPVLLFPTPSSVLAPSSETDLSEDLFLDGNLNPIPTCSPSQVSTVSTSTAPVTFLYSAPSTVSLTPASTSSECVSLKQSLLQLEQLFSKLSLPRTSSQPLAPMDPGQLSLPMTSSHPLPPMDPGPSTSSQPLLPMDP